MDPTQNNDFGSAMPSGGAVGAGMPVGGMSGNSAPIVGEMTPGNGASMDGMTPVGGNPGMGFGNPMVPVSTGTGDIVLDGGGEKKSKKGLVVGLIVVSLIVIGVAICLFWTGFLDGGKQSLRREFNRFANYVLYGEEKEDEIDVKLDISYGYYFNNNKTDLSTYVRSEELYNSFLDKYNEQAKNGEDSKLGSWVTGEKEMLDFMKVVYLKERLGEIDYVKKYVSEGRDGVVSFAKEYYENDLDNNIYMISFMESYNAWVNALVKVLGYYAEYDCLLEDGMDYGCLSSKNGVPEDLDDEEEYLVDLNDSLNSYYEFDDNFCLGVFVINAYINNGNVSDYVITTEGVIDGAEK